MESFALSAGYFLDRCSSQAKSHRHTSNDDPSCLSKKRGFVWRSIGTNFSSFLLSVFFPFSFLCWCAVFNLFSLCSCLYWFSWRHPETEGLNSICLYMYCTINRTILSYTILYMDAFLFWFHTLLSLQIQFSCMLSDITGCIDRLRASSILLFMHTTQVKVNFREIFSFIMELPGIDWSIFRLFLSSNLRINRIISKIQLNTEN